MCAQKGVLGLSTTTVTRPAPVTDSSLGRACSSNLYRVLILALGGDGSTTLAITGVGRTPARGILATSRGIRQGIPDGRVVPSQVTCDVSRRPSMLSVLGGP